MDQESSQIPAPPDVAAWAPIELARSFDRWLDARGIDFLEVEEGAELDRLRSEWLRREGGELDRLRSEWLHTTGPARERG